MTTVSIRAEFEAAAVDKLEKLQRRAARYGHKINWTIERRTETRERKGWDGRTEKYAQAMLDFTIEGDAPRVGPYRFIAELDRQPGGVLISALGGAEIGELGRTWDGRCEHCNKPRGRSRAFVVEHTETGERKIVGRSCLRDYVGSDVPQNALWVFTVDRSPMGDDGDEWGGGYRPWYEDTRYIIAAARAAIALWGWRPASNFTDTDSTRDYVNLLWAVGSRAKAYRKEIDMLRAEIRARAETHVSEADAILQWGADLEPRGDYEHNLKIALASPTVSDKTFGLVVSACAAYDRQKAVIAEREERAKAEAEANAASYHLGAVGERLRGELVKVERTIGLPDNGFGPSVLYVLRNEQGALLKWITGSHPRLNGKRIVAGDSFAADFTVKRHSTFRDVPETVVTRLKVQA